MGQGAEGQREKTSHPSYFPAPSLCVGSLITGHPRWWGKTERRLDPPKALLRWLITHAQAPSSRVLWGSAGTRAKRERLFSGDRDTIVEALRLLEESPTPRSWYVLEGRSQPDACLETDSIILVITWMPQRSQMLRHMDAAMEVRGARRVLGLMIVEGPGGADAIVPSAYWLSQAELQVGEDALEVSLPHRSLAERQDIADGFLGVTTWQRVCADCRLPWPPIEDDDFRQSEGARDESAG